ncbi:Tex family protein [Psychrobium sp. 1_MG-2023]|uniref:Tex family protein n=1 Tax=Psychrobium sp. 1_MG-2023 TaxID=3062624 RepID=UPI000C3384F0|nr:Tex family protein [Psychrobium sp. 1_MG-2023]MDP2561959.1 Tex family protein [Psychrobium sp. 1_MG-2023]PKF58659.1 RNA-binding transcriptional accessory protein [Alteromonadales bacterium alter-6D02]
MSALLKTLASELNTSINSIQSAIQLFDEGATVPFIARYRKEATNGLDDGQLRTLDKRLKYLRELEQRKQTIINSLIEQEQLTPKLKQQISQAQSKTLLEDIYKPFKSKRNTKSQQAIDAGLLPLAKHLLTQPRQSPTHLAQSYVRADNKFNDSQLVLDGVQAILIDQMSDNTSIVKQARELLWGRGYLQTKKARKKNPPIAEQLCNKFSDYFDYSEQLNKVPPHRILAILRGYNEGVLQLTINPDPYSETNTGLAILLAHHRINTQSTSGQWLADTATKAWKNKLYPSLETELINKVKAHAQQSAMDVFAANLHDLLMAAPAGNQITLGLDPGIRTGVKLAIIDSNNKVLATDTIYPHAPRNQWQESIEQLAKLIKRYRVTLVSIGNGTGSRETNKLVQDCNKLHQLNITSIIVSEAGASVYSASELAAAEFPELDVSLRGAISIARRLQDPLAELVKIDPKAIGVGQYQHDVSQTQLEQRLDEVIEDCVNAVGVDLNMASPALLSRISGLNQTLAKNIVAYRDEHGRFEQRSQLLKVSRLGPKAYQQAAGFLRITDGKQPLDGSAVHPESYSLVNEIANHCQLTTHQLISNTTALHTLDPHQFINPNFGLPTIKDVLKELEKPGRDPRPEFTSASFKEGVETINDLHEGMRLEGVVSNVTHFGAFVDIGVHQDGLVHISALADHFVSDPRDIVKAGQIVKVTVTEIDVARKRIALSMKSDTPANAQQKKAQPTSRETDKPTQRHNKPAAHPVKLAPQHNTMQQAFKQAGQKSKG